MGRNDYIEMTGQVLKGGVKVLEKVTNTNPIKWKCQCPCGSIFTQYGGWLRFNQYCSCPDCAKLKRVANIKKGAITRSKKNKAKKFVGICQEDGCRNNAHPDCVLNDKVLCRPCFIGDIEYQPPGITSTLAFYV